MSLDAWETKSSSLKAPLTAEVTQLEISDAHAALTSESAFIPAETVKLLAINKSPSKRALSFPYFFHGVAYPLLSASSSIRSSWIRLAL